MTRAGTDLWLRPQPERGSLLAELDRSVLDDAERERADGCLRSVGGVLYATAHIALRRLLAVHTGMAAGRITFARHPCPDCGGPHGRPCMVDAPDLHFSLTHAEGMVLIGLSYGPGAVPIGVDVERIPRPETTRLCTRRLHGIEQEEIQAVPAGRARCMTFGQLWTRKEAYLKALGTGLSRGLAVDYIGKSTPACHPPGWTVFDVPAGPEHMAGAAHEGSPRPVTVRVLSARWLLDGGVGRPYGRTVPGWDGRVPGAADDGGGRA